MDFFGIYFLPFVLLSAVISLLLPARFRWIVLLCASLAFYSMQGFRDISILLVILVLNIGIVSSRLIRQRSVLIALLVLNVGSLALFKYVPWLYHDVFHGVGSLGIIDAGLPLGISFYVFQLIALAVDSHRNQAQFIGLHQAAAFTTFFPQLVAGPILRAEEHGRQFSRPSPKARDIPSALMRILWGVFKKRVIADSLSPIVSAQFSNATSLSSPEAIAGILAFMLQIYLDFSAYADMAVGIGQLFGIRLPENFRSPYLSTSLRDFWRRWHMTLSSWLRDYIYIPLGGNRRTPFRASANLLITMLIGGLWHGANWTYLVWGAWHGIALLGEREVNRKKQLPVWVSAPTTFLIVAIGWAFFRADSLGQAVGILRSCFHVSGSTSAGFSLLGVVILTMTCSLLIQRVGLKSRLLKAHPLIQGLVAGLLAALLYFGAAAETEFIYWRF